MALCASTKGQKAISTQAFITLVAPPSASVTVTHDNLYFYEKQSVKLTESLLESRNHLLPIRDKMVVNLKTGDVRKREITDYFTRECPVDYDPTADQTQIMKFLSDITLDDRNLLGFLIVVLGYCLTGEINKRLMFICYGKGCNGKTFLFKLLERLFGPYFYTAAEDLMLKTNSIINTSGPSPQMAALANKRLVSFVETMEESELNETVIKRFTGGDKLTGRSLYKDATIFDPKFKGFLLTNFKPRCSDDNALWARIRLIPFLANFVDNPDPSKHDQRLKDENLELKLFTDSNLSALLNILISGAIRYYNGEFPTPQVVTLETSMYKKDQDYYDDFLEENYQRVVGSTVGAQRLYDNFKSWYKFKYPGSKVRDNKIFSAAMDKRNLVKKKVSGGKVYIDLQEIIQK